LVKERPAGTQHKLVETAAELEASAQLVYREYLKRGYVTPDPSELKLSLYQILPQTTTLIGKQGENIVVTVTLIPDSPNGLPMDRTYPHELAQLRQSRRRLAEVGLLALDSQRLGRGIFLLAHPDKLLLVFKLFKLLRDYASVVQVDDFVIAFNPKHQLLYKCLCFQPLGGPAYYDGDTQKPAIARRLDLRTADEVLRRQMPDFHRFFFGNPTPPQAFAQKLRLTPEAIQKLFVLKTPLLRQAGPQELHYIKSCYPMYDFDRILNGHAA
jgi:hypothetical protein